MAGAKVTLRGCASYYDGLTKMLFQKGRPVVVQETHRALINRFKQRSEFSVSEIKDKPAAKKIPVLKSDESNTGMVNTMKKNGRSKRKLTLPGE